MLLLLPHLGGCAARTEYGLAEHGLVPIPASITLAEADSFTVDTTAAIAVTGGQDAVRIARMLAGYIGTTPDSRPEVLTSPEPGVRTAAIVLALEPPAHARLGPEGYELEVTASAIRIRAAEAAGLFYGVQTLRQLLPPVLEWSAARPRPVTVPQAIVEDRPRYEWRGAMLDVARHFFTVDEVKRYIDLLAAYKFNRLHLHLADDQGWRIEIPGWPRLTAHGGSTGVGGGPGGFYTTEEYVELVAYAADRFITIVPEIDMPGHTNAALASIPELNCDGTAPPLYTGIEVGFSALCVTSEHTYEFIDAVIGHLAEITPGPWIHIGGDEVEELSDEEYRGFIERVQQIVRRHGKRMIGWQEIAAAALDSTSLVQHWHGEGAELAARDGARVILSPADHVYIDMKYYTDTPIGLDWSGLTPLRDSYEWNPARYVRGLPVDAVVGIEAPLWAETIATMGDIEFMAFPRLATIAELAWSPFGTHDWEAFRRRIARHGLRWVALGVNYYRSPDVEWVEW